MQQKEKTFKETFDSIFNKIKKEVITGFNWFKNVFKDDYYLEIQNNGI